MSRGPNQRSVVTLQDKTSLRQARAIVHRVFDPLWKGGDRKEEKARRVAAYEWLANEMDIPLARCHFGYMSIDELARACAIVMDAPTKRNGHLDTS